MKRVVVAEDHAIVQRGLVLAIAEASGLQALPASSHAELSGLLQRGDIDVIVLNVSFEQAGFEHLKRVKHEFPQVAVLMLTFQNDEIAALRALRAGASGFLQKDSSSDELVQAIRQLLKGGKYLGVQVAGKLASELSRNGERKRPHEKLSIREMEVFRLIGLGMSVSQIAEKLKLSVKTVSTHRAHILEKTGLRNNAGIIRYTILNQSEL